VGGAFPGVRQEQPRCVGTGTASSWAKAAAAKAHLQGADPSWNRVLASFVALIIAASFAPKARWRSLLGSRNCPTRPPLFRCQSTLAAIVPVREVFPPSRPHRSAAKAQGGRVGETTASGAPLAASVRWHRGGRVGGVFPRAPHLRPGCAGSARGNSCAQHIGRHVSLGKGLLFPRALVDRTCCAVVAPSIAANARWRPTLQLRRYSHPPAPIKTSQAAGRAGGRDKRLERRTCGQRALGPAGAALASAHWSARHPCRGSSWLWCVGHPPRLPRC
jgi:hypothetical protein